MIDSRSDIFCEGFLNKLKVDWKPLWVVLFEGSQSDFIFSSWSTTSLINEPESLRWDKRFEKYMKFNGSLQNLFKVFFFL